MALSNWDTIGVVFKYSYPSDDRYSNPVAAVAEEDSVRAKPETLAELMIAD